MGTSRHFQLITGAARRYQVDLVPTILGPFARALVDAAGIRAGDTVGDIGTGTGEAARLAAGRTGPTGRVIGFDINEDVLAVATSVPAAGAIEWRKADAAQLEVADHSLDVALAAQVYQFVPDLRAAARELRRAIRPGGRFALSVWTDLSDNPYFEALIAIVSELLGDDTAAGLRAAFGRSGEEIEAALRSAGFVTESRVVKLELDLPPIADFVPRHIRATPMVVGWDAASAATREAVVTEMTRRIPSNRSVCFSSHTILSTPA